MLVAPPNLSSAIGTLPALYSFAPIPSARLPFRSLLIASENDPYASIDAAAGFARKWGSEFINVVPLATSMPTPVMDHGQRESATYRGSGIQCPRRPLR
jgi:hypothetical protein